MKCDLTCIGCPLGCALHVSGEGESLAVTGNTCPRGEAYAKTERTAPVRCFTGTVALVGGALPVVSVKTARDVPKQSIFAVAEAARRIRVQAPVAMGDVVCEDVAGTGVALVATRYVAAAL